MQRDLVEALFAQYRTAIYRFLCRRLGDSSAAEELTQDVFVRALAAAYEPREQERAWLFRIARNLAHDQARRRVHRPSAEMPAEEAAPFVDLSLALSVRAAIHRLSDIDRDEFLMREVAGLTYDEIALACELTSDAVRNRLHRTRLALRERLAPLAVRSHRGPS